MLRWAGMWPFTRTPRIRTQDLWTRWLVPTVPEGHASLEAYEAAITEEERLRLPKTLAKLAGEGVERIHAVRRHDLDPDRRGIEYLDTLLGPAVRENLMRDQDPGDPRNLFRVVATEFGCILGEIYVRTGKGTWVPRRAPNLWRSRILLPGGGGYDPFRAVVRQLSDERLPDTLTRDYDAAR